MRFANKLEFGEKTHEVSMTALRVLQRMKRDSIHSGRRPSGLCGAALLMAARLHDFNRTPADIVKIVKVHETTLRKRLVEFGDTPSSALTLDEFMSVDLEEEQDPPAFKAARKKDRERLRKVENITSEITDLQTEIDKQLEEQKSNKYRHSRYSINLEENDADRFVRESNLNVIEEFVGTDAADESSKRVVQPDPDLSSGLGPDISIMGLNAAYNKPKVKDNSYVFEDIAGEVDLTDLDDEELDSYIMSEKESQFKSNLWNKVNEKYLKEQKEKEEKRQREKEEGKPEKKRRKAKKKTQPANTPGEAIEKMLQEKRISSKINYEVLKSLTVEPPPTPKPIPDDIAFAVPQNVSKKESITVPAAINTSPKSPVKVLSESVRSNRNAKVNISSKKRKISCSDIEPEPEVVPEPVPEVPPEDSDAADDADDYMDDDGEVDPTEESIGHVLGRQGDESDYGYDYDDGDGYGY